GRATGVFLGDCLHGLVVCIARQGTSRDHCNTTTGPGMGGVPTKRGGGIDQARALERSDAQEGQPHFGTVPSQGGASLAGCTPPCRLRSIAGVAALHDGPADAPSGGSAPLSAVAAACMRLNRRYLPWVLRSTLYTSAWSVHLMTSSSMQTCGGRLAAHTMASATSSALKGITPSY